MGFIGKFFLITFSAFASVFLGIYLFRLFNENTTFIGLTDVYTFFKTHPIDTFDSFSSLTNHINNTITDFQDKIDAFKDFGNPFEDNNLPFIVKAAILFGQFIKKYFDFLISFGKVITLPMVTLYYLLQFLVGVVKYIIDFLAFVATFEGSTLPSFNSMVI